jgi:L-threonylcarbamoyladenylate synthase
MDDIKTGRDIALAASKIKNGELVAFPTETVYGLGADAFNPLAVARIFEAKERPSFDPLIVHIYDMAQLSDLFETPINPFIYKLAEKFWPGPLTIVARKKSHVPDIVTSGLDTVAVRMPAHPIAHELLQICGTPVAAPSANKFGQLSPTRFEHVVKQNMPVSYILENDGEIHGIESTVVAVDNDSCRILRPGIITLENIREIIPNAKFNKLVNELNLPSPGMLNSHYSPKKPLYIVENLDLIPFSKDTGLILHEKTAIELPLFKIIYTSDSYNLREVAANMFSALHNMEDDNSISTIYIQKVDESGIGVAIMDRLKKAAYQYH